MNDPGVLNIYTDGAARGNPGPAAFAYVIERNGAPPIEEKGTLGRATNNVAEYTALVRVLEHAARLGARRLVIHSDSELLVKQMNGEYQVKSEDLRALFEQAKAMARRFEAVTIRHVRRGENSRADRLCNEALDAAARKVAPASKAIHPAAPAAKSGRQEAVREEALLCLRAAAQEWARGDPTVPAPEMVWDQLWTVLEEAGVLRGSRTRL
jgi:ribonuclease HI